MTAPTGAPASRGRALVWSWQHAVIGAVYAIPAAVVALQDPQKGLPLAVGVLPAVIVGVPPRRRARIVILLVGSMAGVSLFIGGLIAHLPTIGTAVLLVAAVIASAIAASRLPIGAVVLSLCAPLIAAGLSYDDLGTSTATMLLLIAGAAYAWLVSLLWPSSAAQARPQRPLPPLRAMVGYGARLGTAGAIAYLIAVGLGLDHPGWAPAACLLVARPQLDLLRSRGIGRLVSVTIGALAAAFTLYADPPNATYAVLAILLLASAAATAASRWYITAGFTTFFVILMVASGDESEAVAKTNERILETALGVGLAYIFGWALPALTAGVRRHE